VSTIVLHPGRLRELLGEVLRQAMPVPARAEPDAFAWTGDDRALRRLAVRHAATLLAWGGVLGVYLAAVLALAVSTLRPRIAALGGTGLMPQLGAGDVMLLAGLGLVAGLARHLRWA
jgi:hypothetical protein